MLDEQLPRALGMQPNLITVCIGMNDVTRPGLHFRQALDELDELHNGLAHSGATVVTTTFPDLARILPIGRVIAGRVERINDVIRTAAARHGFRLVDLYHAPSMTDLDTWSVDRVHGSTRGHILFAAAAAEALGLPGSSGDWIQPSDRSQRPALRSQAHAQLLWTRNWLMPWFWRHIRGRSSGDGRDPKRPGLQPLTV